KHLLMCRMSANSTFLVDKQAPGYSSKLEELDNFCLSGCFSKPQQVAVCSWKDRRRRVSCRKALAYGQFPDRARSGTQPWAVCDDCAERQIHPDKRGAELG